MSYPTKYTGLTWHQVQAIATSVDLYSDGRATVVDRTASTITVAGDPSEILVCLDLHRSAQSDNTSVGDLRGGRSRGEALASSRAAAKIAKQVTK